MIDTHPTKLLYLNDTYTFSGTGSLLSIGKDAQGTFLVFDETLFYPKGGGQPTDLGSITFEDGTVCPVTFVGFDATTERVLHYITGDVTEDKVGSKANFTIDADRRLVNAKAHTGGHLVHAVVEEIAPELYAKIGSHDVSGPEGCYLKFQGMLKSVSTEALMEQVNLRMAELIAERRAVSMRTVMGSDLSGLRMREGYHWPEDKPCRLIEIEGFPAVPCGGTHVNNLSEFSSGIRVTKVRLVKKDDVTKVQYTF